MTAPGVKTVEDTGEGFLATVRYSHRFGDVDEEFVTGEAIHAIAQGATVLRGTIDGQARVHQVRIPDAMLRGEDDARQLAKRITRRVEGE